MVLFSMARDAYYSADIRSHPRVSGIQIIRKCSSNLFFINFIRKMNGGKMRKILLLWACLATVNGLDL